jgi:hypothetical protein
MAAKTNKTKRMETAIAILLALSFEPESSRKLTYRKRPQTHVPLKTPWNGSLSKFGSFLAGTCYQPISTNDLFRDRTDSDIRPDPGLPIAIDLVPDR